MDTLRRRSTGDTTISPATRDSALPWQRNIAKARELVKLAETSVSSIDGDQLDDSGELTNTPTKEDNGDATIAKWEANVAEFCGPSEGVPRSAVLVELEPQRDEMRAQQLALMESIIRTVCFERADPRRQYRVPAATRSTACTASRASLLTATRGK